MKDYLDLVLSKFKPLIDNASYRINNPLGAAFIFSWIIVNWQAVYFFFFSDQKAEEKLSFLKSLYAVANDTGTTSINYNTLIWWPLFAAIGYLVLAPAISNIATTIWTWVDKYCSSKRMSFLEKTVFITPEERDQMYLSFEGVKTQYRDQIKDLKSEIYSLRQIVSLQDENQGLVVTPNINEHIAEEAQLTVIEDLEPNRSPLSHDELFNKLSTKSNSYVFDKWISEQFDLDIDYQTHFAEMSTIKTIINQLLKDNHTPLRDFSLGGTHINRQLLESTLKKLEIKNLAEKNDDNTYRLSESAFIKLRNILSQ
ncbi:hypothetical protein [Shewanella woodyi]|uniref:hypothetical protein n=1 Tax=Shewanella woodyi TaxID=60961 RepID=UPI0007F9042D|nr:hypothetical protein [Shewanella woodyi]